MFHQTLDLFLQPTFKPIFHHVLSRDDGREPAAHYGTYLFAGSKGWRRVLVRTTAECAATRTPRKI
jgi:hypothetical protein